MYQLAIRSSFAAAHCLRHYQGKCEALHGHNWKVEVVITAPKLNKLGLVIDFKDLRQKTEGVLKDLDHKYLNELPYFKEINPSSENIARYLFSQLKENLEEYKVSLKKVTVWESEDSSASYFEAR